MIRRNLNTEKCLWQESFRLDVKYRIGLVFDPESVNERSLHASPAYVTFYQPKQLRLDSAS
jgi:hypothetical protein